MDKPIAPKITAEDLRSEQRTFYAADGKYTSVAMERCFWARFDRFAEDAGLHWKDALRELDRERPMAAKNFASYLRVIALTIPA